MSSCFMIGHRDTPEEVYPLLLETIIYHIRILGVTEFIVGHYGSFGRLSSQALREVKQTFPTLSLFQHLPYHPAERPIPAPEGFDGTFYPPDMEFVPRRYAIVQANRYMASHADYMIAYVCHPASSAREILSYAIRSGTAVTNLAKR